MEGLLLLYLLTIPADYVDVGVAHYSKWRRAEVGIQNPLATFESGMNYGNTKIYFQHTSSIKVNDYGYGINLVGIKYRIK